MASLNLLMIHQLLKTEMCNVMLPSPNQVVLLTILPLAKLIQFICVGLCDKSELGPSVKVWQLIGDK